MKRTELSVRSGVSKVEGELPGLRLNLKSVRFGRRKIYFGPSFLPEHTQCENFRADENERGDDHQSRSATQVEDLRAVLAIGILPDTKCQQKLRQYER